MATPDIKGLSINDATGHIQTQYRGYNAVFSEKESYGPSLKTLDSLVPTKVSELVAGQRHAGRRLRLRTLSTTYGKGVYLTCRGDEDILVWSLVSYPFGRTSTTLPVGTLIEIREPAFHKAENGKLAICVWHPTDMFFCLQ
ncbi:hypothetical protein B0A48_01556 [Cryoendolithus antarcticus]|uniref:Uncharacterized protein n=1 Tax=Cryoendolithus antarcticus TaxID=1507870 RepID=A0A1V8TQ02_9PEZI|nr:hypothetical protein B0A48_01556 [Cryoendolithus antarcticus]